MAEEISSSTKNKKQVSRKTTSTSRGKATAKSKAKSSKTTSKKQSKSVVKSSKSVVKEIEKDKALDSENLKVVDEQNKDLEVLKEQEKIEVEQAGESASGEMEKTATQKTSTPKKKASKLHSRNTILAVSALAYLIFFLPFIFCREEPFAKYHLNQALVLWIFAIALYLIFAFIPNVNIIVIPIICMFHILGIIIGISYAVRGKAKHLPLIGRITIIKWEG